MSKIIDISHHQGLINWGKVKASGIDFAVIRAGYGTATDKQFINNIKNALDSGVPCGIYWFSYALNEACAVEEAQFCYDLIKLYKINLPVFFDFEYDTEAYALKHGIIFNKTSRTAVIKAFCEKIKAFGYTPGIYTNSDYIINKLNWNELKDYALWLAQWPLGADRPINFGDVDYAKVNATYGKPVIWQFGLGGVDGINTNVDINYGYLNLNPEEANIININESIDYLAAQGVINSPEYWRKYYGELKYLDLLIFNFANKLKEAQK